MVQMRDRLIYDHTVRFFSFEFERYCIRFLLNNYAYLAHINRCFDERTYLTILDIYKIPTYQQQIISQAKSLGKLGRYYIARKCYEQKIDERKVLKEIWKYKSCYPSADEMQILKQLIRDKACPEAIIYQTYVVESMKEKCDDAEETFKQLKKSYNPRKGFPEGILPTCCNEEDRARVPMKRCNACTSLTSEQTQSSSCGRRAAPRQIIPRQARMQSSIPRMKPSLAQPCLPCRATHRPAPTCRQPMMGRHQPPAPPCPRTPSPRTPTTVKRQPTCSPCDTLPPCPGGPRPVSPLPHLNPCPKASPYSSCNRSPQTRIAAPRIQERETPVFFQTPGQTPMTKRRTNIPVPVPDVLRTQKRQMRDLTGTRIPCPIGSQERMRDIFGRSRETSMRSDRSAPTSKKKISYGEIQVSYFEDTVPSLVGVSHLDPTTTRAQLLDDTCQAAEPAHVFKEFKSMIDEEKKEIQEMHNVVTQLIDRSEKVDFRDMYTLVPSISYVDETLSETAPEIAAAMLHSEELGLNMKSAPNEVYNTLFKGGEKDKSLIKMEPEENAKIILPVSSEGFQATLLGNEKKGLYEDLPDHEVDYKMPEMPEPKKQTDEPKKQKGGKDDKEMFSSTMKDEQHEEQVFDLTRMSSISPEYETESSQIDVQLLPDHHTENVYLQIRGSQPPSWFPGYYVAMGENTKINVVKKPWDIFEKAWRKFLPTDMKPDTGTYVLGI